MRVKVRLGDRKERADVNRQRAEALILAHAIEVQAKLLLRKTAELREELES